MKKWLILAVLLLLFSAAAFFAYQALYREKAGPLESIVPDDAIYYFYSYNPDKKIKEFQSSTFFQQLSSLVLFKKSVEPRLKEIGKKVPFLSELLQKDVALAVFSLAKMDFVAARNDTGGDFLLLARVDTDKFMQIRKSIGDFYLRLSAKQNTSHRNYQGIRITDYKIPKENITISYALIGDVLAFSNQGQRLQKCIDLFKNKTRNSLMNKEEFKNAASRIKINKEALLWGYGNPNNFYRQILDDYASGALKSREAQGVAVIEGFMKIKPLVNLMRIFKEYAFFIDYDETGEGLVFRGYQSFDSREDHDNLLGVIAPGTHIDKNTFNLIPRSIIGYYGGSQDLLNSWKVFEKIYISMDEIMMAKMRLDPRYALFQDRVQEGSFQGLINKLESFLGVGIERDILPLFATNFGVVFSGLEDAKFKAPEEIPPIFLPQFYLFVELKNRDKMRELMLDIANRIVEKTNQAAREERQRVKDLLAQPANTAQLTEEQKRAIEQDLAKAEKEKLTLKTESYKDEVITTMEIADLPFDSIGPNYCIMDKYFVLSFFPSATRKVIDAYKSRDGQGNLPSEYAFVLFVDFRKLLSDFTATRFYREFLSREVVRGGFSQEDLNALLNLLSNISSYSFAARKADADTLESVFYFKVKGLPH